MVANAGAPKVFAGAAGPLNKILLRQGLAVGQLCTEASPRGPPCGAEHNSRHAKLLKYSNKTYSRTLGNMKTLQKAV